MTYESSSDTHLVTAYGPDALWIYDVATTNGPEPLQVSPQSGAVVDVVSMPKLYRPLLAADDGGVWVANSIEGCPGPALSYVASGAAAPTTVIADTGLPICWLTATGPMRGLVRVSAGTAGIRWSKSMKMDPVGPSIPLPATVHTALGYRRRN